MSFRQCRCRRLGWARTCLPRRNHPPRAARWRWPAAAGPAVHTLVHGRTIRTAGANRSPIRARCGPTATAIRYPPGSAATCALGPG